MLRFSPVLYLEVQTKTAQRRRNLNMQLSEGKGTLTHTVSDCELAQGYTTQSEALSWRLHSPQSGPLSRMGHSCVLQCTAASSLQPTFSSWTPSACLIRPGSSMPQVQLQCPTFRFPNKWTVWQIHTPGNSSSAVTDLKWFSSCHIYMGFQIADDTVNYAVFLYNSGAGGALCGWCK